jgi:ATP-dependent Clp endopeptidase proteolytic subunit ClpP
MAKNLHEIHEYGIDIIGRQIYLCGALKPEDDTITSEITSGNINQFLRNLLVLDSTDGKITIHAQSIGGDIYSGFTAYDAITFCKNEVEIVCYGACMSIMAFILQSADKRIAMPNCVFMVHEGQRSLNCTHKQAQSSISIDKVLTDVMLKVYTNRCKIGPFYKGKNSNQIKAHIKGVLNRKEDWYLTAEEALLYGLIDAIRT